MTVWPYGHPRSEAAALCALVGHGAAESQRCWVRFHGNTCSALPSSSTIILHLHSPSTSSLSGIRAKNIRITRIQDRHRRATEQFTARSTQLNLQSHKHKSAKICPSTAQQEAASQGSRRCVPSRAVEAPSPSTDIRVLVDLRCCRRSGAPRSLRACCSLYRPVST